MIDLAPSRLFDNPFRARALRIDVRPGRLGLFMVLHGLILLIALVVLHQVYASEGYGIGRTHELAFGHALFALVAFVELGLATLYVSVRCGLIVASTRRNRCLDQLAASGLSPISMCWGYFQTCMASVALLFVVALPYFGLCVMFGTADWGHVAAALVQLFTFTLALGSVAIALGVLKHFSLAFLLPVITLAATPLACIPDMVGMPSAIAALSPVRGLLYLSLKSNAGFWRMQAEPTLLGMEVPCWALSSAYMIGIALVAWGYVLAGPDLRLAPGFNDFDAVTLGARKGKRTRRWRGWLLIRTVQTAFLYENRPRWLKRWSHRLHDALFLICWTVVFYVVAAFLARHTRSTFPTTWRAGSTQLMVWQPVGRVRGYSDECLIGYGFMVVVWAAVIVPYTRRRAADRIRSALDHGARNALDNPLLWHAAYVLMPIGVMTLWLYMAGKPVPLAMQPQAVGLWLMAAAHSLAVGLLVAAVCTWTRYPATGQITAILIIVGSAVGPWIWYPFYLFGLLPSWVAHASLATLPVGMYLAFEPWGLIDMDRVVGSQYRFRADWRTTLLILGAAAMVSLLLYLTAVRRLKKREQSERARDLGGAAR